MVFGCRPIPVSLGNSYSDVTNFIIAPSESPCRYGPPLSYLSVGVRAHVKAWISRWRGRASSSPKGVTGEMFVITQIGIAYIGPTGPRHTVRVSIGTYAKPASPAGTHDVPDLRDIGVGIVVIPEILTIITEIQAAPFADGETGPPETYL